MDAIYYKLMPLEGPHTHMPTEPKELAEARELLGKFEMEMGRPDGIAHLSEALSLLADVRAGAETERIAQIFVQASLR